MDDDFAANLRYLCTFYHSIADVCRRLQINRAQFNRYLSGRYKPSGNTMRRICSFFGVEAHEILLPHATFAALVGDRPRGEEQEDSAEARIENARETLTPNLPDSVIQRGRHGLSRYLGRYHEYYLSMSQPGKVLCTLVTIQQHGEDVIYERAERMPLPSSNLPHRNRYRGVALLLSSRLFLVDYEAVNEHEITETVLYPSFRSHVTRLNGLKLGVADSSDRVPCCVRVVYERLSQRISLRESLSRCGLYDPDDPRLDPSIVAAIRNDVDEGEWHFRARC
ncbi:helix-turn-helix transcriptional regulator [Halomonas huangheensis]|uniref:HTH cro/C1-type domain-containing protein n=1 Tax=Halomonas huangheensis TaxID=1178482 RepID=W1NC78_9GAMM|nr:helix-turn-helix transcriptional regulator [Halomonas huangheensis]ALM52984.1 XRE family transcriptional regulator [Halomonas huangheensis]ERL53088.1 hypothetical protein BJB45_17585 [Halomonas huangheensis]